MIHSLQILRGVAAMLVIVHHAMLQVPAGLGHAFEQGALGVDVFFVVSGFVIYLTGRHLRAPVFLAKRLARVVPLYWFFMTVKLAVLLLAGAAALDAEGAFQHIAASYLFLPAYNVDAAPFPFISSAWTLNYEMFFYLAAAAVLAFLPQRLFVPGLTVGMGLAALGGIALSLVPAETPRPALVYLLHPLCLEFVAGVYLGVLWHRGGTVAWPAALLLIAAGVAWVTVGPLTQILSPWRALTWGIPAVMIVWGFLCLEKSVDFSRWRGPLFLGEASYALYLSHTATLPIVTKVLAQAELPVPVMLLVLVVASTAVGCLVHLLVEKPLNGAVHRLFRLGSMNKPALGPAAG